MSSVGALVRDNPIYDEGILFDPDFYKREIPEGRFVEQISPQDLKSALIKESCIEVAKQVALVALVVIPSVYTLGLSAMVPIIFAGAICAIASNEITGVDRNLFREIGFKRDLLAALPERKRNYVLLRDLGIGTAFKTAFMGVVLLTPRVVASWFAYTGIFFAVYSITKEIEKLIFLCIEMYVEKQAERRYQELQEPRAASVA